MATYKRTYRHISGDDYDDLYDLKEQHIYGSSRLGLVNDNAAAIARTFSATIDPNTGMFSGRNYAAVTPPSGCSTCPTAYSRILGERQYELSNHLGNVIATISDKRLLVDAVTNSTGNTPADGLLDYYAADVLSANDYYAFGMQMPGRSYQGTGYRYGFNGMEKDDEVKGSGNSYDFGARIYDRVLY